MSYIYDMTDTWNDSGVTFNAIKINVTDTASAAGSRLLDLQVGSVSLFHVDKNGDISSAQATNWDTAYGWGDHSTAGYQTVSGLNSAIDSHLNQSNPTSGYVLSWNGTDYAWVAQTASGGGTLSNIVEDLTPQLGGTLDANGNNIDMGVNTITDTKVGQWDTAYGWGDHASAGYLTSYTETDTLDSVISRGASTTTTAVIPFLYANQSEFPSASTYHGAIAHSHADGAMYFAHGGSWNKLANDSDLSQYLTSVAFGDLTSTPTTLSGYGITDAASTADLSKLEETTTRTADYTLALTDAGKVVPMNKSGAATVTIPTNASAAFPIGSVVNVYNMSADNVTIAGDTGVTVRNAGTLAQYGEGSLRKRATDEWVASGLTV